MRVATIIGNWRRQGRTLSSFGGRTGDLIKPKRIKHEDHSWPRSSCSLTLEFIAYSITNWTKMLRLSSALGMSISDAMYGNQINSHEPSSACCFFFPKIVFVAKAYMIRRRRIWGSIISSRPSDIQKSEQSSGSWSDSSQRGRWEFIWSFLALSNFSQRMVLLMEWSWSRLILTSLIAGEVLSWLNSEHLHEMILFL